MNADGHLKRAQSICASIRRLSKDNGDANTPSIIELAYGCALPTSRTGVSTFGTHADIHAGVPKLLDRQGAEQVADAFRELDTIRHGGRENRRLICGLKWKRLKLR